MNIKYSLNQQLKSISESLCCSIIAIITLQASSAVQSEDVKMFSSVPSAKEMANLLFPELSQRPKTRSVGIDPLDNTSSTKESIGVGLPIQFEF